MFRCAAAFSRPAGSLAGLIALAAFVGACSREAPPPAPRAVDVTVLQVVPKDAPAVFEFVGQTQSSREVEIRARVDGFLDKRVYTEGGLVREGQVLFLMDRKPFEASLQQARGELAQQRAKLSVAEANLARVKPLAEQNAVSRKDLDDAVGNEQSARAAVLTSEGSVRQAELNLSYATIASPLTGLSSSARIQEGAYVNASNNLLTTVAQLDPMWVNFSVSENTHLRLRESVSKGEIRLPREDSFEVEVVLADGSVYPSRGRISFADPSFSKETGTFLVRATFANARGTLKPGQFVRVRLHGAVRPNAILVPQRAVHQGAKSHFVWIVGKDGKAEQRAVATGPWSGDDWIISHGLQAGEQVVVDGGIRVSPGAALKVTPYAPSAAPASAPANRAADPTTVEDRRSVPGGKGAPQPAPDVAPPADTKKGAGAPLPTRVHFAYRETALDAAARDKVAFIAAELKTVGGKVVVTGYADRRGSPERNRKFAEDRARGVRDALVAGGVAADRIELRKPAAVVGDGDDAEARRVEIALIAG